MPLKQLIINPGSTSTKLAIYEDAKVLIQESITHDTEYLSRFEKIPDQIPFRMEAIRKFMEDAGVKEEELSAVVGRGGLVPGLHTGGYEVTTSLYHALENDKISSPHASNLGGLLARQIAEPLGIPAYIYDAVTSSELSDVAEITGIPAITRQSMCHVLNSRAMAIRYSKEQGVNYEDQTYLVAHLGGGVSVSVHSHGKIVDSMGDDDGHFSPERSGSVPLLELVEICYSGNYTRNDMKKRVRGRGGMFAHLGTSDCREIEKRIAEGDTHADLIFRAQVYQISKAIGLLSVTVKGKIDAIILTGGMAYSQALTKQITEYVDWIAPVKVMPGENEMEALAMGGMRLLKGEEKVNVY